jgi:hypothetical protein
MKWKHKLLFKHWKFNKNEYFNIFAAEYQKKQHFFFDW